MTSIKPIEELDRGIHAALETYSNVHRGSGHKSIVSTKLYEQARDIVLEYLGLNKGKYVVIFCTPLREKALKGQLVPESFHSVTSRDIGLPLGVIALGVKSNSLPSGAPFQTGGGTAKLISPGWVIWANGPDKLEAGTPSIINIIAFAIALRIVRQSGNDIFRNPLAQKFTAERILFHDELEKFSGRELLHELRKTIIGRNILVPTVNGLRPYINLDNSASTSAFTPVWNAYRQTLQQSGQIHEEIIEEVRSICYRFLGASPETYDLIFTSNTTEAINLAAESLGHESEPDTEYVVINTLLEHSSNDLPWRKVSKSPLIRLSIDDEGFVNMNELETLLLNYNHKGLFGKKRIKLVAVSGASNVLGTCNNIAEISRLVHQYGVRLFVDAAQLIAHRKVEMETSQIDYLTFSAHKVYAPFGTGVLVVKKGLLNFSPGEMELIKKSGEENAAGIAALGKAFVLLHRIGMDLIREEEHALTERALTGLAKIPGMTIYGIKKPDSPGFPQKGGVIAFSLKTVWAHKLAPALAETGGLGVRSGCHCAHILVKQLVGVGPFLERFQGILLTLFPKLSPPGIVRISLGIGNTPEDIDELIRVINTIAGKSLAKNTKTAVPKEDGLTFLSQAEIEQQIKDFVKAAALRVYS